MAPEKTESTESTQPTPDAAEHIAEAHRRLTALRQDANKHPDLDAAIERLEMALSILTTKTGGML
jgi:hypothetical protein